MCNGITFAATASGADVLFGDIVLCAGCTLELELSVRHIDSLELDPRPPIVGEVVLGPGGAAPQPAAKPAVAQAVVVEPLPEASTCAARHQPVCAAATEPGPAPGVRAMFEVLDNRAMPSSVLSAVGRARNQVYVSGTLLSEGGDLCLGGVSVLFEMPLEVVAPDGSIQQAAPEDFLVDCFAVKVAGPEKILDASCEQMAAIAMTDRGPLLSLQDVPLCATCWLAGGANGIYFSVEHVGGLPLAALPVPSNAACLPTQ